MKTPRILILACTIGIASAVAAVPAVAASAAETPGISIQAAQASPVPDDVTAYLASPAALEYVHTAFPSGKADGNDAASDDANDTPLPDLSSANGFGDLHELFSFSKPYVSGDDTTKVVLSTDTWIASIHSPKGTLGYLQLWKQTPTAAPEPGLNSSTELGALLDKVAPSSVVIQDAPSGEWFTADGTTLTPLNKLATLEVPAAASLEKAQDVIAERYDVRGSQAAEVPGAMGGSGALYDHRPWYQSMDSPLLVGGVAVVILGLAGLITGVVLHRRRPQS